MKRDLDLIRRIIIRLAESEEEDIAIDKKTCQAEWGVSYATMKFHADLLVDIGYVVASHPHVKCSELGIYDKYLRLLRLTWAGCDYYESIKDDSKWAKVKKAIAEKWPEMAAHGTVAIIGAVPSIVQAISK